jgi:hypothetical protein
MTFQGSADGTNWANIYTRAGVELTYTIAADRWVVVDPADFVGADYLKIRYGTAASGVVQSAKTMTVATMVF